MGKSEAGELAEEGQVSAYFMEGLAALAGGGAEAQALEEDQADGRAGLSGDQVHVIEGEGQQWMAQAADEAPESALHFAGALAPEAGQLGGGGAAAKNLFEQGALGVGQNLSQLQQPLDPGAAVNDALACGLVNIVKQRHGFPEKWRKRPLKKSRTAWN